MSWDAEWRARVHARIVALGYHDVLEFVNAFPSHTYLQLAEVLGAGVFARQVELLEREESIRVRRFERFARSCLARCMRDILKDGWSIQGNGAFHTAHAYGAWSAALGEEYDAATWLVWTNLKALAPPGWIPLNQEDPIIERAFHGVRFDEPVAGG